MTAPGSQPAAPRRGPPASLTIRNWPLMEGGLQSWFLLGLLAATALMVGRATGSGAWALAAWCLTAVACWRFFVPATFVVNGLGITVRILNRSRRISWRSIDRCEPGHAGVMLMPNVLFAPSLRGLYIAWGSHREELLSLLEYYLDEARTEGLIYEADLARGPAP